MSWRCSYVLSTAELVEQSSTIGPLLNTYFYDNHKVGCQKEQGGVVEFCMLLCIAVDFHVLLPSIV